MKPLEFKCVIDGCDRYANYREKRLCQMHYFRLMRGGIEKTQKQLRVELFGSHRKYRVANPAGYQKLYEPLHPLSNQGYVYEHRKVIWDIYGNSLPRCELCECELYWDSCHIDHKNNDVTDNSVSNLRPLCGSCNTSRGYPSDSAEIEIDGVMKSIMQWARHDDCKVSHATIKRRLKAGFTNKEAVFADKLTHKNGKTKKNQIKHNLITELEITRATLLMT